MRRKVFGLAALCLAGAAHAMTLLAQGDTLFATGPVGDDFTRFSQALAAPGITRVVFVNSPGGDLWTGLHVGRLIQDKKLNTVIAGYCHSACSVMFMGGVERTFSDAFSPVETVIGIHGPNDLMTHRVSVGATSQIYAFYKMQMGDRFNSSLMNKALYEMGDAEGLLRVFDPQREMKRSTYHCRSGKTPRKECEDFKDQDALTLGIVTSAKLTKLDLPEGYKAAPLIAGRRLTHVLADLDAFIGDMTDKKCASDHCRQVIADYVAAIEHKAIAFPVSGPGVGTAFNRSSAADAYFGALYACNHVKDKPIRLCDVTVVDGYDMHAVEPGDPPDAVEALAKLEVPAEKTYGGEDAGGTNDSVEGYRVQNVNLLTPLAMNGLRNYTTQELARELKGAAPPVVIDVFGLGVTLPGAQALVKGGIAYSNQAKDAAYEARFAGLLRLLAPDPAAPLVFVGGGRDWLALNAAQRARKLGYQQVGWYRGGLASWFGAKLPFAISTIRAVVEP